MALVKIKDFDPNYKEAFSGHDIKGMSVYSEVNDEKIGTINDLLVDEQGYFRYFIVDLGFWGLGKKVLLPINRSQIGEDGKRVYALGFTKDQVENLPEFSESLRIDNDDDRHNVDRRRDEHHRVDDRPVQPPTTAMQPPIASSPENISTAGQVPPPASVHGEYSTPMSGYPATGQPGYAQPNPVPNPAPNPVPNQTVHRQPAYDNHYPQSYPGYSSGQSFPHDSQPSMPQSPQAPMQQPMHPSAQPPVQPPVQQSPQPPMQPPMTQPPRVQEYSAPSPHSSQQYSQHSSQQFPEQTGYVAADRVSNQSYRPSQDSASYDESRGRTSLQQYEQRFRERLSR
jgi:hypothetical protein